MPDWVMPNMDATSFNIEQQFDELSVLMDANPPLEEMAGISRGVLQEHAMFVVKRITESAETAGIPMEETAATLYSMGWIMGYHWAKRGN